MRLFIADADPTLRVSLQMLLHEEPGMYVIGMADRAKGLLAQVEASQPDVLLLDTHLPGRPMTDLIADLKLLESPLQIVALSVRPEEKNEALAAGADAFIGKVEPPDELLLYLRTMRNTKPIGKQE